MFPYLLNPSAKPSVPYSNSFTGCVSALSPQEVSGFHQEQPGWAPWALSVEAIRQNTGVMEREEGEPGLLLRAAYGETSGRFGQN